MLTYTIFAGVNGVGIRSIFKSIYYYENKDEMRININEADNVPIWAKIIL